MKITAICLCWIMILTTPGVMGQQTNTAEQSWDVLEQLHIGERIRLERKDGKKYSGNLIRLENTELVMVHKNKAISFIRDDVRKVWRFIPPSRTKRIISSILTWAVVASLFVPIILFAAEVKCDGDCSEENAAIIGSMVATAGASVYTQIAWRGKHLLIYTAP
jgi:hypothetical protein